MKKFIALVLVMLMLGTQMVFAETVAQENAIDLTTYTNEELLSLKDAVEAELAAREEDATPEAEEAPAEKQTLQKGDKNDAVKELQKRLIELNYLSGSADGDYGNNTKNAVSRFQKEVGLEATGIADADTQEKLFSENAPAAKVYRDLEFKAISRDPDSYTGKSYKFSGKVIQVMEEKVGSSTYVVMRIATKGNYDNVVYVTYFRPDGESRILEDDRVTVYATCKGLYTYESTMGKSVTLPYFNAESVSLK